MDSFIVSIGTEKKEIKLKDNNTVLFDEEKLHLVIQKVNNYYYLLSLNGKIIPVTATENGSEELRFFVNGEYYDFTVRSKLREIANSLMNAKVNKGGITLLKAPMPGMILRIHKKIGDQISKGDPLITLEAMKMENEIKSPVSGSVKEIFVPEGKSIEKEEKILSIE